MTEGMNTARSSSSSSSNSVSFQQASELNSLKDLLKNEHVKYVEEHPELKHIMSDFLSQVLLVKPEDIRSFAKDYFAAYLPASEHQHIQPLCIVGPSGVGKGTLVKRLFKDYGDSFGLCVSHTTRRPRDGEEDGVHYHFTDVESMQGAIDNGEFVEFAHVHGNIYGTSIKSVEDVCEKGLVCLLEIDIQGVKAVRGTKFLPKCIYIAPPSFEVLEQRLRDRATESESELEQRLVNAKEEMAWLEEPGNADRKIVNDDLEDAYQQLVSQLLEWYPHLKENKPEGTETKDE